METKVYNFADIMEGYIALKYAMAIVNIEYESKSEGGYGIGFIRVFADGILIFKALSNRDWKDLNALFSVVYWREKESKPKPPIDLWGLRRLLIKDLKRTD